MSSRWQAPLFSHPFHHLAAGVTAVVVLVAGISGCAITADTLDGWAEYDGGDVKLADYIADASHPAELRGHAIVVGTKIPGRMKTIVQAIERITPDEIGPVATAALPGLEKRLGLGGIKAQAQAKDALVALYGRLKDPDIRRRVGGMLAEWYKGDFKSRESAGLYPGREVLVRLGENAGPLLVEMVRSGEEPFKAVKITAELNVPAVEEAVADAVLARLEAGKRRGVLPTDAINMARTVRSTALDAWLVTEADDKSTEYDYRDQVVAALAEKPLEPARQFALRLLTAKKPETRYESYAIDILLLSGKAEDVPVLASRFGNKETQVAALAAALRLAGANQAGALLDRFAPQKPLSDAHYLQLAKALVRASGPVGAFARTLAGAPKAAWQRALALYTLEIVATRADVAAIEALTGDRTAIPGFTESPKTIGELATRVAREAKNR